MSAVRVLVLAVGLLGAAFLVYRGRRRIQHLASRVRAFPRREVVIGLSVLVAAGFFACIAYYLQVVTPDIGHTEHARWWVFDLNKRSLYLGLGALCAFLSVAIPIAYGANASYRAVTAREAAIEGSQSRQVVVNGVLMPVAGLLGQLAGMDRRMTQARADLRGQVKQVVLAGLTNLMVEGSGRACYYELSGDAPHRVLRPAGSWGRSDLTSRPFMEGTPQGDQAIKALDDGQARYWSNGDPGEAPPGWDSTKVYNGYISVPVATDGRLHGMLTIDTPDADAFDFEVDVPTVELLGRLLAAALSA